MQERYNQQKMKHSKLTYKPKKLGTPLRQKMLYLRHHYHKMLLLITL